MTSQPLWEQIKAARISRSGLIGLVAGIALGLALGLLIGWVWWPVEWESAGDTATAPKAEYLSLVADAYQGAAGAGDAINLARARLAALAPLTAADFLAATEFYAAQPGRSDQVRNLVTLSIALGMPLDVTGNPAVADAMRPDAAPDLSGAASAAGAQAPVTASEPQPQQESGGVNGFALVLLLALLLIAGGAYLYWTVLKRRERPVEVWTPSSAGGRFADEIDDDDFTPGRATSTTIRAFDPASAQGATAAPAAPRPAAAAPAASTFSPRSYSTLNTPPPVSGPAGFDPEEDFGAGVKSSTAFLARPELESDDEDDFPDDDLQDDEDADAALAAAIAAEAAKAAPVAAAKPALRPATPTRYERYKTMESFSAAFHAGMANVDFTRNIKDEQAGRYIGEYGMFVHERHGLLNNNLDDVIAFEVTLFDKADESQPLTTIARTLISEYAHDHLYSQFSSEGQNGGAPIIAQKDTSFQLEANQLLLDCTIMEVSYTAEGIFRTLTLDMVLKRR